MALFTWDDTYSVGIERLDKQHRELVGMINGLHDAMKRGSVREALSPLLDKLVNYALVHFAAEEGLMLVHKFPGYTEHKKAHEAFARQAREFRQHYEDGSVPLTLEVMGFLMNWVKEHVRSVDRKYAPYLNDRGVT